MDGNGEQLTEKAPLRCIECGEEVTIFDGKVVPCPRCMAEEFDKGFEEGQETSGEQGGYDEGYEEGYEAGYNEGEEKGFLRGQDAVEVAQLGIFASRSRVYLKPKLRERRVDLNKER